MKTMTPQSNEAFLSLNSMLQGSNHERVKKQQVRLTSGQGEANKTGETEKLKNLKTK
jgi:hypothetical protein